MPFPALKMHSASPPSMSSELLFTLGKRVFVPRHALPYDEHQNKQAFIICATPNDQEQRIAIYEDNGEEWFRQLARIIHNRRADFPTLEILGCFKRDSLYPDNFKLNSQGQAIYIAEPAYRQPAALIERIEQLSLHTTLSAFGSRVEENVQPVKQQLPLSVQAANDAEKKIPGNDWQGFATKLPPSLIDEITKLLEDPEMRQRQGWVGNYARMFFVEEACRLHLQRLLDQTQAEHPIESCYEQNIGRMLASSAQVATGQSDEDLACIISMRAKELGLPKRDLIRLVVQDSIRHQKGFWKITKNDETF